jgi:hypothetical protein
LAAPHRRCRPNRDWPRRQSRCGRSHCADRPSLMPPRGQRKWRRAMFEKIAKFRLLRARRVAGAPERSMPANDNRRSAARPGRRRPQLVCRWSFDQGASCRWEIAGPLEPSPLQADEPPSAGAFTQTSSYCRTTSRAAGHQATVGSSTVPNLLQARHKPPVIGDRRRRRSCHCKSFASRLARFQRVVRGCWSRTVLLKEPLEIISAIPLVARRRQI